MMRSRGMTLLEVLAATALMATIAASLVPIVRQALRGVGSEETVVSAFDLMRFSADLMADLSLRITDLEVGSERSFLVSEEDTKLWVTVRRIEPGPSRGFGEGWLQFEAGGAIHHVWVESADAEWGVEEGSR